MGSRVSEYKDKSHNLNVASSTSVVSKVIFTDNYASAVDPAEGDYYVGISKHRLHSLLCFIITSFGSLYCFISRLFSSSYSSIFLLFRSISCSNSRLFGSLYCSISRLFRRIGCFFFQLFGLSFYSILRFPGLIKCSGFRLSGTLISFQLIFTLASAQDSILVSDDKSVTLKEVIVRSNLNVAKFIQRVQEDSSFYKAFKNLHILGYTALNDIRMMGKNSQTIASLNSRTRQQVKDGCRWMETLEESTTGDIYTKKKDWNYYTAEMYAGLFFTQDTICGENNIVGNASISKKGKSGIQKHKEQLKMLFFNPGKKIPGIPFIGDKIAIFEGDAANRYDFIIDMQPRNDEMCYVFTIVPRKDLSATEKDQIVINEMTTWFRISSWEIVARNYNLSYRAGVYDFDVDLRVELGQFGDLQVPTVLHYRGNWDVAFKKRERCFFTATLFDFTR